MSKIWAVVRRELQQLFKNPAAFGFNIILPIILVAVIGQLNFGTSSDGKFSINIPVVMQDNNATGQQFLDNLKQIPGVNLETMSLEEAEQHVKTKADRGGYILVPAGFGAALSSNQPTKLVVVTSSDSGGQVIRSFVQSVADRYNTTNLMVQAAAQQSKQDGQNFNAQQAVQQAVAMQQNTKPAITVDAQNAGGASFNMFDQVAPGYATMFVIFGLNTVALTILADRQRGTLRRLAVMPLPKWAYISGKMVAQFIVSFLQVSVMLAVAKFVFGAHINGNNFLGILLLIVTLSFAATALGMLIASAIKSENAIRPVVTLVALLGSMVGGSWFPLWLMPDWIQQASKISINSWAMQGFNSLMIFGQGLAQVIPSLIALTVYGAICLFLATRLFRYTEA